MTTLTAYYHLDLDNASIWDGEVTVKDATHIQIKDSTHEQNYYGSFTFASGYLINGTITSTDYSEFESGAWVKKYDINGGSYNALTVFKYLAGTNNESRLLNYVFGGDDTLNGSFENDVLSGYKGNDHIFGNDGNDILNGGAGADTLEGGSGNDEYYVDNLDTVIEGSVIGIDTIYSKFTYMLPVNVENLILQGKASINGTGNDLDNILTGNIGANILDGAAGADSMFGDKGNDTYIVDNAGDIVTESSEKNGGKDLVKSSLDFTLGDYIENLTLTGSALKGTGNGLNNIIIGNEFANTLDGAGGTDTLIGGAGDDTYIVDLKNTGNLQDSIKELAGGGTDTLELRGHASLSKASTLTLSANLENLDASSTGNSWLNLKGNALANILTGNAANNILTGLAGNDTLIGSDGEDLLIGGKGADTYNLTETIAATDIVRIAKGDSLVVGYDVVNGFKLGEDKLDLASNKIAANTAVIDGTDSGGIGSHSISNGLISFDDTNSALFTVTTDNIASAFAYLQANITGKATVAFNSDGNTYVFQDGGANDTLVQLTGIAANGLDTIGSVTDAVWIV
jgi:Ca2+-binding RTX toxin-like protein